MKDVYLVLDFDSTFVTVESLDLLADKALGTTADRERIAREIQEITKLGMEGVIPFSESLSRRLKLFRAHQRDVAAATQALTGMVSPSIARERQWIREHADRIHIISGGFKEIITPVVEAFGIAPAQVHANDLVYDADGYISGVDETSHFAHDHGKATHLRSLELPGIICAIGDGYTDYEMKSLGGAHHFFAFTENISRPPVISLADRVFSDFKDVRDHVESRLL
ncbi:HAD-IB family phosphatase [Candidatus Kaiserbacteria bacterium]|nr:HAD-IB family phosphatase [Candidatus Kaiserbacteria bacterium]